MSSVIFQIVITFFQDFLIGLSLLFYRLKRKIIKMGETFDCEDIMKKYQEMQTELEVTNQTLYDLRREIKISHNLEFEYQDEIRVLQSQEQELRQKVLQGEEAIVDLKASYNERINTLTEELAKKEDEIDGLKKELERLDDIVKKFDSQNPKSDNNLLDEISRLENLNVDLNEKVCDLQESLELSEQKNINLQERVKNLESLTEDYKESLNCKREELEEAHTLLENLKDENLTLKSELDLINSKPRDDQSKGNSLFAEVDDRRLQLQQNMSTMKSQYLEMKRERASHLKQISTLRNENALLISKMETEIEDRKNVEEQILDTYKNQIKVLNELTESYKKEIETKENLNDNVPSSGAMKFFDNMLATKNKEMEVLRQELKMASLNRTSLSYDLAQAKREIWKNNVEALQLKNEIGQLKIRIEEMQMVSPTEKTPEQLDKSSIVKKNETKTEDLYKTNKENEGGNKKVQFSEDTLEPKVTDRKKMKGGKKLVLQSIKYD
ncbi:protein Spindly [Tribolium madens]|uniref:protein Spindly n=1 Tax=Tribolium madens TaxID=41895 RepID=UPI001CF731A9|nr:protein Spindly [Tribolium madens]